MQARMVHEVGNENNALESLSCQIVIYTLKPPANIHGPITQKVNNTPFTHKVNATEPQNRIESQIPYPNLFNLHHSRAPTTKCLFALLGRGWYQQ